MGRPTVAEVNAKVDANTTKIERNSSLLGSVVDKIDVMMDRQLEVGALREEIEKLKVWFSNGYTTMTTELFLKLFEERDRKRREEEKDERIKELEAQTERNREYGKQRDKARARQTSIIVAIIAASAGSLTIIVSKLLGG